MPDPIDIAPELTIDVVTDVTDDIPRDAPIDVTVVICSYTTRRWADLVGAVESVQAQRPGPLEILVVVDHDEDLFQRAQELAAWPAVRVIRSDRTQGLSGARNTGIAASRGSVIAFLDDDAVAAPGWLAALCGPILRGEADGVGGRVDADFPAGRPGWFPTEFDWVIGCTYRGHPEARVAIRNPIGCNMAFRASALAVAGAFREDLGRIGTRPLGCEETELCIRLAQRLPGVRIVHEPEAQVTQRIPAARERVGYFLSRCYAEGLSKAAVATSVGRDAALSTERSYLRSTLPVGVWRGLRDAVRERRPDGAARAGAIVLGLAATTLGFLRGQLADTGTAIEGVA